MICLIDEKHKNMWNLTTLCMFSYSYHFITIFLWLLIDEHVHLKIFNFRRMYY